MTDYERVKFGNKFYEVYTEFSDKEQQISNDKRLSREAKKALRSHLFQKLQEYKWILEKNVEYKGRPNWAAVDYDFDKKDEKEDKPEINNNHCPNCSVDKQFLDSRYKDCLEAQQLTYQDNIQILVPAVKIDLNPTKLSQITNRIIKFLKDFQNHPKPKTKQNQFDLITKFTCLLNAIYEINKHQHLEEIKDEK